jgi:uncharacterized protein (TIGR02391 family)
MEQQNAYVGDGHYLLQELARSQGIPRDEEIASFASELELAHNAGFLTWTHRSSKFVGTFSPTYNPNMWLQTIEDIKLTLAGRDRARGRVIQVALPDPDEDDGRIITGFTLEQIAQSISNTYTVSQLPRYLRDSDIPVEYVPDTITAAKLEYVSGVLESLLEGGSAARRSLRHFIGSWLEGNSGPPPETQVRQHITSLLAQQGWEVRNGRLVIVERVAVEPGTISPLDRDSRLGTLHPDIRRHAAEPFVEDQLDAAIFEAFKAINNRVKDMTGLNLDGAPLIDRVVGPSRPTIVFADLSTQTGKDIQQGLHFLLKGALLAIRNPRAHEQFKSRDEVEALEELALASLLMRRLDAARVADSLQNS